MGITPSIPYGKWKEVGRLYRSGLPMREVAERMDVSIDVITYVLRKTNVPRRSFQAANQITFENKIPSFTIKKKNSRKSKALELIGAMLYWAEGYKTNKASGVDFANSDPDMALCFMRFLDSRYTLNRDRLYCQIYYYSDQDISAITDYWAKKLQLPTTSFRSPYMKINPKTTARKLPHGVVHIRYNDKKLLRDLLNLIESYRLKYASVAE